MKILEHQITQFLDSDLRKLFEVQVSDVNFFLILTELKVWIKEIIARLDIILNFLYRFYLYLSVKNFMLWDTLVVSQVNKSWRKQ